MAFEKLEMLLKMEKFKLEELLGMKKRKIENIEEFQEQVSKYFETMSTNLGLEILPIDLGTEEDGGSSGGGGGGNNNNVNGNIMGNNVNNSTGGDHHDGGGGNNTGNNTGRIVHPRILDSDGSTSSGSFKFILTNILPDPSRKFSISLALYEGVNEINNNHGGSSTSSTNTSTTPSIILTTSAAPVFKIKILDCNPPLEPGNVNKLMDAVNRGSLNLSKFICKVRRAFIEKYCAR